jgi:hypothetical protein
MEYVRHHRGCPVLISIDPEFPNVHYIDRGKPIVMAPIDRSTWEISQGRVRLGEIIYQNGRSEWGWRYYPRSNRLRPSRKLHPNSLSAIRGRLSPDMVVEYTAATFTHQRS